MIRKLFETFRRRTIQGPIQKDSKNTNEILFRVFTPASNPENLPTREPRSRDTYRVEVVFSDTSFLERAQNRRNLRRKEFKL